MTLNGAKLLIDEIDRELDKKTISNRDRLMLRSHRYQLEAVAEVRSELIPLKKHDVIGWAQANPKSAWLIGIGGLVVNSMINWASIRKPLVQAAIMHTTGVLVPLDNIP
jgi:hypothetical protein